VAEGVGEQQRQLALLDQRQQRAVFAVPVGATSATTLSCSISFLAAASVRIGS